MILKKHHLCYGFLYKARFLRDLKGDLESSVNVYKQGYETCKDKDIKKFIGLEYFKWRYVLAKRLKWSPMSMRY